jgi:hypothetical protein
VAAPFLASTLLLVFGSFLALAIEHRLAREFAGWRDSDGLSNAAVKRLNSYAPDTVAQSSVWTIDAAQIVATFLQPLVGIAIMRPGLELLLFYIAASVVVLSVFFWFVFRVPVDSYHATGKGIFTLVPLIGIPVNLAAAGVAALIGP